MNPFKKKPTTSEGNESEIAPDRLLDDLPRGQDGRRHLDNFQQHGYFENLDVLEKVGFEDHAGHNFLGVVNGHTQKVLREDDREEYQTHGGTPVGVLDDRHVLTVAGSRSGKGRSIIIPQLLSFGDGSVIVNDVKAENAAITARYRAETLGQDVHIIDPFNITPAHCAKYRKQYNPMTLLRPGNLNSVEDAGLIADAIVASVAGKDPHWDESAKNAIETLLLHVATGPYPPQLKNLNTVYGLLSGKHLGIDDLLEEMLDNTSLDGRIIAGARTLQEMSSKERGSVLSTARRHAKFLDYDGIQSVFAGHDFDLNELKTHKTTIYLVLPATRMSSCKGMLRLFINLTLGMVEVETTKPEYPILAILDELPVLGYMKQIEDAIGQVAGLGLRLHCILQDLNQLKAIYKDRYESFMGNSGIINVFGTVDEFTSKWVSSYLGKTTIRTVERSPVTLDQKVSGRTGQSYRNQTIDLMSPEEVRRFLARDDRYNRQLVLIPGKRPWILQRIGYDNHELFEGRFDLWR